MPRGGESENVALLFDRGVAYLKQRQEEDPPFMLFLHTFVVHNYFVLHPWALEQLDGPETKQARYYLGCLWTEYPCSDDDWRLMASLYKAELSHMDAGVGRVLEALAQVDGETYVIFVSDHGEGFDSSTGRTHHGGRLHEDLVRVPLLVAGPGVVARDVETPVSIVDILPTTLDLAEIDPASIPGPDLDGRSFEPRLQGGQGSPEEFARTLYAFDYFHIRQDGRLLYAPEPREEPYLIALFRGRSWYIRSEQGEELYDMIDDPRQTNDLAGDAVSLAELRNLASTRRSAVSGGDFSLSPEVERQLRALGYIQ